MSGLIIFLHGFRGRDADWGAVPVIVKASLSSFDVISMDYSAEPTSYADMTRSAEQILTRIKTDHPKDDPIFLIGYSMGGIIAREICLKLLETPEDKSWLTKIRGAVTVGSPLSGLQPAVKASAYAGAKFLTSKVSQVADTKTNVDFVFGRYARAMESAKQRGTNGPKQIHIEIENDGISAPHEKSHFTSDDLSGGVIEGTHREFMPTMAHVARLANLIIQVIREQHSSLGRKSTLSHSTPTGHLPDRLLLLACSNRKRAGGENAYGGPGPARWIADAELREKVLSRRSQVLSLLKAAQIDNGFEAAENRLHQAPNKILKRGPDFGGVDVGDGQATYLPAWQRYDGRCYTQIDPKSWDRYFRENSAKMSVLIMSGLYGLIEATEWIQEYDIHLTDRVLHAGIPISSMWIDLFTDSLIEYVKLAHRNRKVQIINCLCDESYNDSIHWRKLPPECSVYHLASPDYSHTNLLPPAGTVIDCLLRDPERIDRIKRSTRDETVFYPVSDFGSPPESHASTHVAFEARLGDIKDIQTGETA
jgi:pimeloyl-ACP methyl ester carboxylesterase